MGFMKNLIKRIVIEIGGARILDKFVVFYRRVFPRNLAGDYFIKYGVKKLQIGSGINHYEGWLNTDYDAGIPGVLQMDATKVFPFEDKVFDFIFCQHMIEHISYQDGQFMLKECLRVLKPGGKVRISTPNLAMVCGLYTTPPTELQMSYMDWSKSTWVPNAPKATPAFVINNFFRNWGHQFIYDKETLREAIERVGFREVQDFALNESGDAVFRNLENEQRLPKGFLAFETITFEGTKKPE
jgi:predicted SAM-dependent methyltransferase